MPFVPPSLAQLLMAAGIPAGIALALFVARGFGRHFFKPCVGIIPGLPFTVPIGFSSGVSMSNWETPQSSSFPALLFITLAPFAGAFLATFVVSVVVVWWISIQSSISGQTTETTHFEFLKALPGWIERMNPISVGLAAGLIMMIMFWLDASYLRFSIVVVIPLCIVVAKLLKILVLRSRDHVLANVAVGAPRPLKLLHHQSSSPVFGL